MLLLSPVWVAMANISETTYTYERAEVVNDKENGITYNGDPPLTDVHISVDIGCSVPQDTRVCAFERTLLRNETVPTETYTNNPTAPFDVGIYRYEYVQINGSVYDPSYVGNQSAQRDDGLYRLDLALKPASASDALRQVSINISTNTDVSPVVVQAARQGSATADRKVEIPQTTLLVDADTYYRVYLASETEPGRSGSMLGLGLSIAGPLAGLYIIFRLFRRIEINHVDDSESRI
jgi:hypothetical protein